MRSTAMWTGSTIRRSTVYSELLANPALSIPSRERSRRMLTQLKVLAENMDQLEKNTNFLLRHVLNGGENGFSAELVNGDKENQQGSREGKNP